MPQNRQRFHGHPRVTRSSMLYASLGGLNGGISYTIIHDPFRKGKIVPNRLNYNIFGDQDKGAAGMGCRASLPWQRAMALCSDCAYKEIHHSKQ